jgi:hypothetical protein
MKDKPEKPVVAVSKKALRGRRAPDVVRQMFAMIEAVDAAGTCCCPDEFATVHPEDGPTGVVVKPLHG